MSTRTLTQYAVFLGIILLLGLTPIGYITLPIAAVTIVHVPVIIGSYHFGPKGGMVLGTFFGLTSLITCFTRPDAIAAIVLGTSTGFGLYNVFLIIVVLFVPRILVGLFSALVYRALHKENEAIAMGVAAFTGSITNTVFLLGALYVFAFQEAGLAFGLSAGFQASDFLNVLLGIVLFNSLAEAAVATLLCTAVGRALSRYTKKRQKSSS